jgi:opacity protein-like surface antigen
MRKLGIITMACVLMVAAVAAFAADTPAAGGEDMKGQFAIGAGGGLAMPMGKLAESFDPEAETSGADMKMGPSFGIFVDYFVTKEIAVGVDASYTTMNMNDQTIDGTTYKDLVKAKTMQFGVHGKYFVPTGGPLVPYLSLGAGFYSRKLELSQDFQDGMGITDSEYSDSKPGVNAGVGVEYKVSPMFGIGANGAYHYTIGKFEDKDGFEILKDWNYIGFNAAVTYHIPMAKK